VHHLTPTFPFGFGLSYTSFTVSNLSLSQQHLNVPAPARPRGKELAWVTVRDTGSRAGTEVVQVYLGFPPGTGEPPRQLEAFVAVSLKAHQGRRVELSMPATRLRIYLHGRWQVVPGLYHLEVGTSSSNLALSGSFQA